MFLKQANLKTAESREAADDIEAALRALVQEYKLNLKTAQVNALRLQKNKEAKLDRYVGAAVPRLIEAVNALIESF